MTKTWIVYKAESMDAEGWEQRRLLPSNAGTEILWENWDFSGKMPQIGDRTRDYENLTDPGNGVTHGKDGDWVVNRIEHFSSFDTSDRIVVCYCTYSPINANWQSLRQGKPVHEMLGEPLPTS